MLTHYPTFLIQEMPGHYRGGLRATTLLERARDLRKGGTVAEKILWERLRDRRLHGFKFRRQHQFGGYILDFFCVEIFVAIELDGAVHDMPEQQEYDRERDEYLREHEVVTLRFRNWEVEQRVEYVLQRIAQVCLELRGNKS